jgi:hypothetical protein
MSIQLTDIISLLSIYLCGPACTREHYFPCTVRARGTTKVWTRLERYTLWSTLTFQRRSSRQITVGDVSRLLRLQPLLKYLYHFYTKEIPKTTMVTYVTMAITLPRSSFWAKATMVTNITITITFARSSLWANNDFYPNCCNNVPQQRIRFPLLKQSCPIKTLVPIVSQEIDP